MKKVNDYLIYRKDVCKVLDIKESDRGLQYVLVPINDLSLKITANVDSDLIRDLVSKEDIDKIIKDIPNIGIIEENDKLLEAEYKKLMKSASYTDLIKIIKTTYLRNEERALNMKKMSDKDNNYFNMAEKYLYTELAVVLNMNIDDTKKYITDKVREISG